MFSHPKFCVRFLNEEIRNSDIYVEGSEFRRLAYALKYLLKYL